ncbi:HAMP domain-containing sensor histidine kinase [Clostridium sp. D43t1_170807_H7]|uniref:HAMP domain-containing sensor histidine kinase n=1 Tax=Clostridium sp. D43t1_170807_H7 TaxID=2787140 RepID=UPI001898FB4B|nr:HAMP domain-containing sensor histidine kinase [Clostridium sp. D43t1_170807_H7]
MKKKLLNIIFLYIIILVVLTVVFFNFDNKDTLDSEKRRVIIDINEIRKESELLGIEEKEFYNKIDNLEEVITNNIKETSNNYYVVYGLIIFLFLMISLLGYIYYAIIKPFERMEEYAEEVAKGNLDLKLNYERNNLFGEFTWAFDRMRREIIKARTCEKEAIENNKTVIATLSHDIKTPIASIRAYTEGLQANLASNPLKRQKYINIIIKKCDEVTALTNDIFLHSLADLGKLKMNLVEVSIKPIIIEYLNGLLCDKDNVFINDDIPDANLLIDTKRFEQVLENIINNSLKYAKGSKVEIKVEKSLKDYILIIRDYGKGISDEDMPFIFEKFYRGKNVGKEQGAGLGLYIVKYIMEQFNGNVYINSFKDGLEVRLIIPLIDKIS